MHGALWSSDDTIAQERTENVPMLETLAIPYGLTFPSSFLLYPVKGLRTLPTVGHTGFLTGRVPVGTVEAASFRCRDALLFRTVKSG